MLFFDLGGRTGYCFGQAGKIPTSDSIVLREKGEASGLAVGKLARWLRDHVRSHSKPDLIGVEHWMAPGAQKSGKAVEDALRLNGAIHAVAGVYGINITEPYPASIRKEVCGRAFVPGEGVINGKKMSNTKILVIQTVILRGMAPKDCVDGDRCDAIAGWIWLESHFSRMAPANFVLQG